MTKSEHGTRPRYVLGCRCDPCTVANRDYQREYMRGWYARQRAKKRDAAAPAAR